MSSPTTLDAPPESTRDANPTTPSAPAAMDTSDAASESPQQEASQQGRTSEDHEQLQLVTFVVENEEYAVDILQVQEINRMMDITRVPQSPECVEGVINLRGRIIPVVDLRRRFGIDSRDHDNASRIVVVEVGERVIGFTVDQVNEVLRVDNSVVEPAPSLVTNKVDSAYIDGVGKLDDRLLILLDLSKLLHIDELTQIDRVTSENRDAA